MTELRTGHDRPSAIRQAAGILAMAVVCGALANTISPRRIPWREDWSNYIEAKALKQNIALASTDRAKVLFNAGTHVIFDARPAADYREGHIAGAHSLPYDDLDNGLVGAQKYLTPAQPILVYCSGTSCDDSFLLALFLRKNGFTNVVLYTGGFDQWKAAGLPVEGGAP